MTGRARWALPGGLPSCSTLSREFRIGGGACRREATDLWYRSLTASLLSISSSVASLALERSIMAGILRFVDMLLSRSSLAAPARNAAAAGLSFFFSCLGARFPFVLSPPRGFEVGMYLEKTFLSLREKKCSDGLQVSRRRDGKSRWWEA